VTFALLLALTPIQSLGGCCPGPASPPRVESRELVQRIPASDERLWASNPDAAELRRHPAVSELGLRIECGEDLGLDVWRTLLIDKQYLRWRPKWPVGRPFAVALHVPAFGSGIGVRLEAAIPDWKRAEAFFRPTMCATLSNTSHIGESYQELGFLDPRQTSVRFTVLVVRTRSSNGVLEETQQRVGTFEIEIEPVDRLDLALQPSDDSEIGPALAPLLRLRTPKDARRQPVPNLGVKWASWPRKLSIVLDVELWHRGKLVSSQRLRPARESAGTACKLPGLPQEVARGKRSATGWSVRLSGTSDESLRDWDATHYWADAIEIDLADLLLR
jgi:hypothetical protein